VLADFYVSNNIQLFIFVLINNHYSSGKDGILYIFVAKVNVNSDGLNVNVNRFENDNVWNAEYAHRLVVPATNYFL